MSDRLTLAHAIEDAGIERAGAERVASAIFEAIRDNVATRVDIAAVRADVSTEFAAVRTEMAAFRADVTTEFAAVRTEMAAFRADVTTEFAAVRAEVAAVRADVGRLESKIDLIEHRLLTRLGGLMVVLAGLLFAALRYWPPGHG